MEILGGGQYDDSKGYFVQPTIVETKDPHDKIMVEEIFGPVLTIYVYKDKDVKQTLELVGTSTKFALTGAVFAQDEWVETSNWFLCQIDSNMKFLSFYQSINQSTK